MLGDDTEEARFDFQTQTLRGLHERHAAGIDADPREDVPG